MRPTGRAAAGAEPSRPRKATERYVVLAVVLACIVLGGVAAFFVLGFSMT